MWGFDKREVVIHDFEYRVTAKKSNNGNVFYIGHSTNEYGALVGLYHERYTGPTRPLESYGNRQSEHYDLQLGFVLVLESTARMMSYRRAEFRDPIRMRDTICQVRKTAREKIEHLAYSEVVSEGECKC